MHCCFFDINSDFYHHYNVSRHVINISVIGLGQIVVTSNGDRTGPQRPRKLQNTKSHKHEIPKTWNPKIKCGRWHFMELCSKEAFIIFPALNIYFEYKELSKAWTVEPVSRMDKSIISFWALGFELNWIDKNCPKDILKLNFFSFEIHILYQS